MTEINSNYLDANSYVAKHDRIRWQDILSEGIIASGHFEVTEKATPDMGVTVAAGRALIEGDDATDQGVYYAYDTSSNNLTISAADGSNDRVDRVILQVYDSTDISGDTEDKVELEVVTGTPAASPSAPAIPDNAISLATVSVGAGVTSISNSDITDTRSKSKITSNFMLDQDDMADDDDTKVPSQQSVKAYVDTEVGANADDIDELETVTTTITSSATPTPARASTHTLYEISALAENATLQNPTGTPQKGDRLLVWITDNGTPRDINYDTDYADGTAERATSTTASTKLKQLFIYDGSNWCCDYSGEDV